TARFPSRIVREISRAGVPSGTHSSRPASTFGRGRVAGRVGGQIGPRARRVVIKSRFVKLGAARAGSSAAHLRYIVREGVSRDGARGQAYGANEDKVDLVAFEERSRGDRHQFRFIVSVEDAQHLDGLQSF